MSEQKWCPAIEGPLYPDFPYRGVPYPLKGATYSNTINILKLVIAIYELLGLMESEGDEK